MKPKMQSMTAPAALALVGILVAIIPAAESTSTTGSPCPSCHYEKKPR